MVVLFSIRAMALEFAQSRAVSSRTMVLLGLIKGAEEAGATRIRSLHKKSQTNV